MSLPRLTQRRRQLQQARPVIQHRISTEITPVFRWLWRRLYPELRTLRTTRDAHLEHGLVMTKALSFTPGAAFWREFESRLAARLEAALLAGTVDLAAIERAWWAGRATSVDINPAAIIESLDIGSRVVNIAETTRREIGNRVKTWYDTPGATFQEITDSLSHLVTEDRAALIAVNETTELNSAVTDAVMGVTGVDEWTWNTRNNEVVCTQDIPGPDGAGYAGCRALHGRTFRRGDLMPPKGSHIGCFCNPIPKVRNA